MTDNLFCFGYGYTAAALATRLGARGWRIAATARDAQKVETLAAAGVAAYAFDSAALSGADLTHILVSAPPDEAGDPVLARYRDALIAARGRIRWVGYLSTTGVYGDHGGDWVDEDAKPAPTTERGRRRAAAERVWLETGLPVHIFRLAGIYGPNRSPFERIRSGAARRVLKPGQVFGRIHVEDAATALAASIAAPAPGRVYNLADDLPCPPEEVLAYAAALLGLPPPPAVDFADAGLSPMARSFYSESKRASNARIKQELGVALAFPSYREGLRAVLEAEGR